MLQIKEIYIYIIIIISDGIMAQIYFTSLQQMKSMLTNIIRSE